jgi:hypothetical protein
MQPIAAICRAATVNPVLPVRMARTVRRLMNHSGSSDLRDGRHSRAKLRSSALVVRREAAAARADDANKNAVP